ncbi:DUF5060 domain-containing protein [Pelagicoccus albus]|uniref:DUF5060 domain-containing protein n=1 Tax=Pelagicoccus albus TaxID=415222 RepID=A0A7X1B994_9BACT|nr:DUF5060 domain-containing protein [Pelagicoccus albus]MBC2608037.1 DUF5060 domain-containing protein [Pelagicoccus albus]
MKPKLNLPRLLALASTCFAFFVVTASAEDAVVEKWGRFEILLNGPAEGNPFMEVELEATFTNGFETKTVSGFYDGDGVYRIRFMPEATGEWRYRTQSSAWELSNQVGEFEVVAPSSDNHGPVSVYNTYHFAYADETPYWVMGTTSYTWTHRPAEFEELTLKTLEESPFNKLRMCVFPQTHGTKMDQSQPMPPERFPFEGEGTDPNYERFNPEFFQHLEMRVQNLQDLGIEADLILFHPYDDDHIWGLDHMDDATEERYIRYIVARLSSYRNVWWSIANEFDFVRNKTDADWDRNFQVVVDADPYGHLRSIHNGKEIYDNNKPWVTHASIQNGAAADTVTAAQLYRDVYRKPVVYDELEYEGNHDLRWAQLTGEDLVHRFWAATAAGTYGGHSEFIFDDEDTSQVVWLGQGGELKGDSPERLAFLLEILENGPLGGFEPIDKWHWDPTVGQPGVQYLTYFGRQAPEEWEFKLYKGLEAGMKFKVEIIDAWNMTITPVKGVFEIGEKKDYHHYDTKGRSIQLDGKPYQALRITRVN